MHRRCHRRLGQSKATDFRRTDVIRPPAKIQTVPVVFLRTIMKYFERDNIIHPTEPAIIVVFGPQVVLRYARTKESYVYILYCQVPRE